MVIRLVIERRRRLRFNTLDALILILRIRVHARFKQVDVHIVFHSGSAWPRVARHFPLKLGLGLENVCQKGLREFRLRDKETPYSTFQVGANSFSSVEYPAGCNERKNLRIPPYSNETLKSGFPVTFQDEKGLKRPGESQLVKGVPSDRWIVRVGNAQPLMQEHPVNRCSNRVSLGGLGRSLSARIQRAIATIPSSCSWEGTRLNISKTGSRIRINSFCSPRVIEFPTCPRNHTGKPDGSFGTGDSPGRSIPGE